MVWIRKGLLERVRCILSQRFSLDEILADFLDEVYRIKARKSWELSLQNNSFEDFQLGWLCSEPLFEVLLFMQACASSKGCSCPDNSFSWFQM